MGTVFKEVLKTRRNIADRKLQKAENKHEAVEHDWGYFTEGICGSTTRVFLL